MIRALFFIPLILVFILGVLSQSFDIIPKKYIAPLATLSSIAPLLMIFFAKKNSKKDDETTLIGKKDYEKIDFSKIPAAPGIRPPKPIDKSGDQLGNSRQSIADDLKSIGIDSNHRSAEDKDK